MCRATELDVLRARATVSGPLAGNPESIRREQYIGVARVLSYALWRDPIAAGLAIGLAAVTADSSMGGATASTRHYALTRAVACKAR